LSNAVAATLMALLVTCLSRLLARWPAILHGLWLLVLLKLVTPPFYEVPIPWPMSAPTAPQVALQVALLDVDTVGGDVASGEGPDNTQEIAPVPLAIDTGFEQSLVSSSWSPIGASSVELYRWIGAAWLAGSVAVLLLSIQRIRRFQSVLVDAREASWLEQEWVDDWSRRLGLRWAPDLRWVPGRFSPMIWFVGPRPRLIIPDELWKRLDAQQRSTLLVHELSHLRRRDHYVRLLELLATALFWWHPLVWWMRGPLRDVEEQCCDAWVVWALPDAVRSYAETLLNTLEFLQQSGRPDPLLASGLGKVPHLRRRLTMIMTGSSRRLPGLAGKLGLLAAAGAMLPIGATWAQNAEEPQDRRIELRVDTVASDLKATPEDAVVVLRADGQDPIVHKLEVSGSLDEVVKKLQAEIAELKKGAGSADAAKERIEALVRALDEVKKANKSLHHVTIHSEDLAKDLDVKTLRFRAITDVQSEKPQGEKAAEIAKSREEISKLKVSLKETLGRLAKEQAKLRELGEDAGEVPVIEYRRQPIHRVEVKAMRLETPRAVAVVKPSTEPIRARTVVVKPPAELQGRLLLRNLTENKTTVEALDATRIESLERRLKALQDELDRLKKAARPDDAKKQSPPREVLGR
jgi:beta-lactamase regulating signal transducer with metallopeptidase domain